MTSRLASILATLGIVALLSFGTTSCASGSLLVAANTNECVLVPWHGYPIDGTQVRLRQCIGKQQQYWNVANGQITGIGGSCLDVSGAQPVDGARVIYVACNGSPSQHWNSGERSDRWYRRQVPGLPGGDRRGGCATDHHHVQRISHAAVADPLRGDMASCR